MICADKLLTKRERILIFITFGQQYVSSAGFSTPTSLASAARIVFLPLDASRVFPYLKDPIAGA